MGTANQKPAKYVPSFSKAKILTMKRFEKRRDLLTVLLEDGKEYTLEQAESVIQNFMTRKKGKVK